MESTAKNALEEAKKEIGNIIQELNSTTACFTGHRCQKLPWGFNETDIRCLNMKHNLRLEIIKALNNGYRTFICGMAIGFDMICAETVLELKKIYPDIKIIGAIPCKTQDSKWSKASKHRYRELLKKLDGIRCIYDEYIGKECMLERNRYMINNSSLLIALFNGKAGGTKSTIDYAKKQGLNIVLIEP